MMLIKRPQTKRGILFIVSGPSGVGKGTIREKILKEIPDLLFSVSVTTRDRRPGEIDGKDYIFVTVDRFREMIEKDELLEWAEVYGHYYGTPLRFIEEAKNRKEDVLLEIDIQGAKKVMEKCKDAVSIFIAPPSIDVLIERLKKRATETEEELEKRIVNAKKELEEAFFYDYYVINDNIDDAVSRVKCIILSERLKIIKERR